MFFSIFCSFFNIFHYKMSSAPFYAILAVKMPLALIL